jgi:opacity protein-like surface antigen
MKRLMLSLAVLVIAAVVPVSTLAGQNLSFHLGGGLAMGSGDLNEDTDTGWTGFAGADYAIMSMPGLSVGVTASYAHIPYQGDGEDATNIPAVFAQLGYAFGATSASRIVPWVRAGVGMMQHKYDPGNTGDDESSESSVGFAANAGLSYRMQSISPFIGVGYATAGSETAYMSAYVGLRIAGGPRTSAKK